MSYRKTALNCLRLFVVVYKLVIYVLMNSSWLISEPNFIVRGPTISKLYAQTHSQVFIARGCLLLFTIYVLMNCYHGKSVHQVPLLEDPQKAKVTGNNIVYKFLLHEAACCCLQTCTLCFDELLSWSISVPNFIIRGPTISKLWAQNII